MKSILQNLTIVLSKWQRFFAIQFFAGVMLVFIILGANTAGPVTVNLGSAEHFRILAKSGISTSGSTIVTGNIGVSPALAASITGFGLRRDASGIFSSSSSVIGDVYAAGYKTPTSVNLIAAVHDMEAAYNDAAGRTMPDFTDLGGGDITLMTLKPGLYKWTTDVFIDAAGIIISGNATDVWIFQITGTLDLNNNATVTLAGGAKASNIFWQVSDNITLGKAASMKGILLTASAISMQANASLDGRAYAQTVVTLDAAATIPEEPVSFTAATINNNVELRWTTAAGLTDYGFDIERRKTTVWEKIAFIKGEGTGDLQEEYSYTDNNLSSGHYAYRLKQVYKNRAFSYHGSIDVKVGGDVVAESSLLQNFPNPFNPSTKIKYILKSSDMVTLKIFDMLGHDVATLVDGPQAAGIYTIEFNTNKELLTLPSGVYFYRLEAGAFISAKKFVLMK